MIKALQAQLGHTDSRLTLSVYTQPMPEAQRQLASKITRVLLPIAPKSEDADSISLGIRNDRQRARLHDCWNTDEQRKQAGQAQCDANDE